MNYKMPTSDAILAGLCIIGIILITISMIMRYTYKKETIETSNSSDTFIEFETHLSYCLVYDKDTKVIYYKGYDEGDFEPLYNQDGSLKLFVEEE